MDYLKVTVSTTSEGVEPVTGRLYRIGITGVEIDDAKEFRDFLEKSHKYWDYADESVKKKLTGGTTVSFYIPRGEKAAETLDFARETMKELAEYDKEGKFGALTLELANVSEKDWAENWKQYYKPTHIGQRLVIVPKWEEYHKNADEVVVTMDPGMAFGTGTHESTQLCLAAAEKYVKRGNRVLDLGCGSGILSIAARLLGSSQTTAVDIDPVAVKMAGENAALNGIGSDVYHVLCGDIISDKKLQAQVGDGYDIVFANIVADVIIALATLFTKFLKRGGTVITSGIITARRDEVHKALCAQGLRPVSGADKNGWSSLIFSRE